MELLGFALAALIGLSLGLMGGGGSVLTVPIFVYTLGFAARPALAMSLPVVRVTSLVGAASHWRAGNVHLRTALLFGVVAMVGAFLVAARAVHPGRCPAPPARCGDARRCDVDAARRWRARGRR